MVVFTCGHCGESVNKPKVEKHYLTKCKNRNPNLSCMDCFKDFMGNDYAAHTKCITEEERYSGKGFTAKEKKGEKKQNAWVEMLQSVLDEQKTASKNVLRIIETISKHNNTPRKKPKFFNFVKNVCGAKTSAKDIEQAWELISVKLSALSNNNRQEDNLKDASNVLNGKNTKDESEKDTSLNNDSVDDKENQEESGETEEKEKEPEPQTNGEVNTKLSKKQKKEEKKRRKYEAELQQVEAGVDETEEQEAEVSNKTKKNKNKTVENGHSDVTNGEVKGKNKKRKRQDTVNTVESIEKVALSIENDISKVKVTKKKPKTDGEIEAEENLCLHDQNVAHSEIAETTGKFNWHAVIVSVLQKKGNEVPFKRLQKKVLTEYTEFTGSEVDDRIADKFIKKLKSAPNVKVDKNRVILIDE